MSKPSFKDRKQQLVRDAIYEAAIELFAAKGFDETTVEDVALAAGVSRRSFFRYFQCKDDLLALNVMSYERVLVAAIEECRIEAKPLEVIRETVLRGAAYAGSQPHTRQVIQISLSSGSAMQAHQSRMMELAESITRAFTRRLRPISKDDSKPRLFANLTVMTTNVAITLWFQRGRRQDIGTVAIQVFDDLTRLFSGELAIPATVDPNKNGRRRAPSDNKQKASGKKPKALGKGPESKRTSS